MTRFCIVSDDDGHHYVIPVDRQAAFDAYVESAVMDEDAADPQDLPDWAIPVNGPISLVHFIDWTLR